MLAGQSYLTGSNFPVNATVCIIDVAEVAINPMREADLPAARTHASQGNWAVALVY